MSVAVVSGSSGLIGSEAVRFLHAQGMSVIGIDNDLRGYLFGPDSSTKRNAAQLLRDLSDYRHHSVDIRDLERVNEIFAKYGAAISLVVHTAGQPSHE